MPNTAGSRLASEREPFPKPSYGQSRGSPYSLGAPTEPRLPGPRVHPPLPAWRQAPSAISRPDIEHPFFHPTTPSSKRRGGHLGRASCFFCPSSPVSSTFAPDVPDQRSRTQPQPREGAASAPRARSGRGEDATRTATTRMQTPAQRPRPAEQDAASAPGGRSQRTASALRAWRGCYSDRNDQDADPSSDPREKYRPSLASVSPLQPGSARLSPALPQHRRRRSAILRSPLCEELWQISPFPCVCFPSPARLCPTQPSSAPAQTPALSDPALATLRGTLASSPAPPGEGW